MNEEMKTFTTLLMLASLVPCKSCTVNVFMVEDADCFQAVSHMCSTSFCCLQKLEQPSQAPDGSLRLLTM